MNRILIYRLNSNGKLSYIRSVNTGGIGGNISDYSNPVSRSTIQIYSNYLFVVNPGSDSLSMFTINTSDATTLTPVTPPQTTGHFPVSVAVNSMYACVLSIGYYGAINCFTYNSSGLTPASSFNLGLTGYTNGYISSNIWNSRSGEILFSASNLSLIVTINDLIYQQSKILFFSFNGVLVSASNTTWNGSAVPLSVTLVGTNGLFITTPSGVQFMTYQLTNGIISANLLSSNYFSLPYTISYPTFSLTIGSYFAISSGSGVVQMNVNINGPSTDPFSIVPYYYPLCNDYGPLGATIVTANNTDYMFVVDSGPNFISSYQLQVGNSPTAYCYVATQANSTVLPRVRGIAAYIQNSSTAAYIQNSAGTGPVNRYRSGRTGTGPDRTGSEDQPGRKKPEFHRLNF
jgi:hypothetical protein